MRPMHIDFDRSPRQPALGWWMLLAGLALLSLAMWQCLHVRQQQATLRQAHEQQEQARISHERQQLEALPPPTPPYADDPRWRRAAAELTLPWIATLRAVETATKPPVFLVGFKSDPVSGRLLLDAEAPSFDAALDFVSTLQAAPALSQTQILSHEDTPDPQGRLLTRFSLQTQWVVAP